MAALRVFVVDDEAPARKKIVRFLAQDPGVSLVGEAATGADAIAGIQKTAPDLVFLDIQMPGMDGFDVVRALESEHLPQIVFATAHEQYTMQALDVHAFAYLLKPFDEARFAKVLEDAKRQRARRTDGGMDAQLRALLDQVQRHQHGPQRLLVQQKDRAFFLAIDKIDWAEAERNYLNLHVGRETHTIRATIDNFEQKLDPAQFLRLNRSAIVRIDFIRELRPWFHGEYKVVLQSGDELTWTRRYRDRHPELLLNL
jgi:two-component system, LytTR family, response regulator